MRFSEILLIATLVTGVTWMIDTLFFRPRRVLSLLDPRDAILSDRWWVEYSRSFFPILLVVFLLRGFLIEPFRIPSGSMRPTLLEGDFILVNKYAYGIRIPILGYQILKGNHPERGDIIVFRHDTSTESMDMIKRVVGLPNDRIRYTDKVLYVNDQPMNQEFLGETLDMAAGGVEVEARLFKEKLADKQHNIYIYPEIQRSEASYPFTNVVVPPGMYFVMGDNRDNSKDSRVWGFVNTKDIQGKAFGIWMSWNITKPFWQSWDNFKQYIRWERIGTGID